MPAGCGFFLIQGIIPLRDTSGNLLTSTQNYAEKMGSAPSPPPRPGKSAFDLRKSLSSLSLMDEVEEDPVSHLPKVARFLKFQRLSETRDDAKVFPVFSRLQAAQDLQKRRHSLDLRPPDQPTSLQSTANRSPRKFSSTSSLYVKDTINLPDIDDLTRW